MNTPGRTRRAKARKAERQRITVQVLSLIDGSFREVTANVTAATEQDAVNALYAIAKDEMAYKYLGHDGVIAPEGAAPYTFPKYAEGNWYAKG